MALQKKISSTSEAAIILEGGVAFQEKPLAIFVKLKVRNGARLIIAMIMSYPACNEIARKRPAIIILQWCFKFLNLDTNQKWHSKLIKNIQSLLKVFLILIWKTSCGRIYINISSVVEFQRWWVLKSKIFAMWWPGFKDFIWFFEMEERGASEASNYNWS